MALNWDLITKSGPMPGIEHLQATADVDGELWVAGTGKKPSRLMIVGQHPTREELEQKKIFISRAGCHFNSMLATAKLTEFSPYITNAVKYGTLNNAAPKASDIKNCLNCLMHEIEAVQPELIITLGATALKAVAGKKGKIAYAITDCCGDLIEPEWLGGIKVLPLWHPSYLLRQPEREPQMLKDMDKARRYLELGELPVTVNIKAYTVIESAEQLAQWLLSAAKVSGGRLQLALDSEWEGAHPGAEGAYLRTVQLCTDNGKRTAVIRLFPTKTANEIIDPKKCYPNCANTYDIMTVIKMFLENTKGSTVFGQNIIADCDWFLYYGLDIRPYTIYDTMLAEHLIDNRGPFNLTELTLRHAPELGRYDRWLKEWTKFNPDLVSEGYGAIPEDLIFPYGAGDVQAPWAIMRKQFVMLQEHGYFDLLGHDKQYPSLFEVALNLSKDLYELQKAGLKVDREQLDMLTKLFNTRAATMHVELVEMAAKRGFLEFNPNSTPQKRALLFGDPDARVEGEEETGGLGLTPLKATGKRPKSWEWVIKQPPAIQQKYNSSTDGQTLEMLQEKHPLVKVLLNYNRINTVCKNFLREDETGGINGNIWADGRIHSNFSQLSNTSRLRSSSPNCQNFPKAAEGYIREIFKDEKEVLVNAGELLAANEYPPSIRTVFVPADGCILLESDYVQAELFVLGAIAEDEIMLDVLSTPGKDMHDTTTIDSFGITVLMPDGTPYNEQYILDIARVDKKQLKALQAQLLYVDPRGRRLSRDEFKDTLRVSGKSINFGIPYGRGAHAIANQINAETGLGVSDDDIQLGIDGWHNIYVQASLFIEECHRKALTDGYVSTIWGRRRYFGTPENRSQEGSIKREAANHPIQGTVGDTMAIALHRVCMEKKKRGLAFKVVNQVHDALLLEVPEKEIDEAEELVRWGMGEIELPMPGGPRRLAVDIDYYTRWGNKEKKQDITNIS